jgi:hypothetical protein
MKFYSVDFEPLGIRAMQTGNLWTPYLLLLVLGLSAGRFLA